MRRLIIALATVALTLGAASPAAACLNDMDTVQEERQFKALYPDAPSSTSPDVDAGSPALLAYGGSGVGVALLGAAGYLGLVRRRW
jgi:hypothetical protein